MPGPFGPEVALLVVDDLDVLVSAAVLLVTAGGHGGRVRLCEPCLHLGSGLALHVGFGMSGSECGLARSFWGMNAVACSHNRWLSQSHARPGWRKWFWIWPIDSSLGIPTTLHFMSDVDNRVPVVSNVEVRLLLEVRQRPWTVGCPPSVRSIFISHGEVLGCVGTVGMRVEDSGTWGIAPGTTWVHLQDLRWLFHQVMARDPCGGSQQLPAWLMLIDDHVAGGVTAATVVSLSGDRLRSLHGMQGTNSLPVQGVRVDAVRIGHHLVGGPGPASATTAGDEGSPVMRKKNVNQGCWT